VEIAHKHATSTSAVAIAWTMRNGAVISIPESGQINHIRENAEAVNITLDTHDLEKLDHTFPAKQSRHWSGT